MQLAVMQSRINVCVPFGKTGYPLVLAMNVDEGRNTYLTDSAVHLLRTPMADGSGGVRSSAENAQMGTQVSARFCLRGVAALTQS